MVVIKLTIANIVMIDTMVFSNSKKMKMFLKVLKGG